MEYVPILMKWKNLNKDVLYNISADWCVVYTMHCVKDSPVVSFANILRSPLDT